MSQSVTTSPKENKPASGTSFHVHCSKVARPGGAARVSPQLACHHSWPRAQPGYCERPLRPSRWRRVPGGGAHWRRGPQKRRRAGVRVARLRSGVGPTRLRPLHCCPGSDQRPPAPGGAAASAARALGRCLRAKGSDLVSQQSLLLTATQLEAKAGRAAGAGRERAARGEGGKRARPRRVAGDSGRQLDLLVSQLRRRGPEEPVLPKTNRKWITERPGQLQEGFCVGV